MRTIVKGKNIDVRDQDRQYADRKMHRLERFLDDRSDAVVELSTERHKATTDTHIAEVTLVIDGQTLRGKAAGPTHQAALDSVIDRIERQAVDFREKPRMRARPMEEKDILRRIADGTAEPVTERRIVKTKRFAIQPMFEEDAVEQMEELGHSFFVFVNAENEKVSVIYRRDDGNYGLIEPVVGGQYMPKGNGKAKALE